jgi:hypothetical protein
MNKNKLQNDYPPIWLVALLCSVGIAVLFLSGCSDGPPAIKNDIDKLVRLSAAGQVASSALLGATPPPPSISEIANEHFAIGMKLGYAAAHKGATERDILFLIQTKLRNDPAACDKWFMDRGSKP